MKVLSIRDFDALEDPMKAESLVDAGLRHKRGSRPVDFLNQWLNVGRCFGYATKDDSWGEFEKIFSIIVRRLVVAERNLNQVQVERKS